MRDEIIDVLSLIVMCLLLVLALKIIVIVLRNGSIARQVIDCLRQLFI